MRRLAVEGASGLFVAAVAGIAYLLTACMVRCVTASAVSLGWAACSQTVRARLVSATIGFTVIARVYAREGHLDDAQGQGDDTEDGTGDMGPWVAVVEPHNEEQVWATGCRRDLTSGALRGRLGGLAAAAPAYPIDYHTLDGEAAVRRAAVAQRTVRPASAVGAVAGRGGVAAAPHAHVDDGDSEDGRRRRLWPGHGFLRSDALRVVWEVSPVTRLHALVPASSAHGGFARRCLVRGGCAHPQTRQSASRSVASAEAGSRRVGPPTCPVLVAADALAAPGEGAAYSSADVRAAPGGEAAAGTAPAEAAFSSFGYWGARAVDAGRSLGRAAITLRPLPAEASAADAAKRSLLPGGSPPVSAELSIALHASLMAALRPTPGLSPGQAGSPAGSAAPALGPDSTASTDEGSRILAAPETVSWVGAAPRAAGASTGAGSVGFQVRHFVTYPVVEPATLLQAVDEVSAAGAEEVEARVAGLAERAEAAALLRGRRDPAATPPADGPGPALGAVRSDGSVGEAAAELCDSLHERFHHPCVSFLARPVVGASRAGGGGVGAEEFFVAVPLSDAEDEEGVAGLTAGASDEELGRSAGRRDGGRAAAALGSPLLLRGAEAPAGGTVEVRVPACCGSVSVGGWLCPVTSASLAPGRQRVRTWTGPLCPVVCWGERVSPEWRTSGARQGALWGWALLAVLVLLAAAAAAVQADPYAAEAGRGGSVDSGSGELAALSALESGGGDAAMPPGRAPRPSGRAWRPREDPPEVPAQTRRVLIASPSPAPKFRPTMDAYDAFALALPLTVIAFATLRLACRAAGVDAVASGGTPAGATCLGLARFGEEPAEPWSALLGQERAAEDELPVALEDMKRVLESRLLDVARAPLIGRGTRRRLPVQGDEDGA